MRGVFIAAGVALAISILVTPYLIRFFMRQGFGQEIREDGPSSHKKKRGTPTMGGVAILLAIWVGYLVSHLLTSESVSPSAMLVLGLTTALGCVGFLDDFIKLRRARNLGLNALSKIVGQVLTATVFAVLAMKFANAQGLTPGSEQLSFVRDIPVLGFGFIGFIIFANLLIGAFSNAVNLTDGLDGLAAGTSALVLATYTIVGFWQFRNGCALVSAAGCYQVRDPLDVALVAAAAMGGCIGFLWWNAAPARIFMGDTGSLALGGLVAGLAIVTRTELLLVVIGGVFVVEALSVALQIAVFRTTRRRRVPDGAVPPPLRARRLGRDHGDHPLLAARGDVRGAGAGPVLLRLAGALRRSLAHFAEAACTSQVPWLLRSAHGVCEVGVSGGWEAGGP